MSNTEFPEILVTGPYAPKKTTRILSPCYTFSGKISPEPEAEVDTGRKIVHAPSQGHYNSGLIFGSTASRKPNRRKRA